MILQHSGKLTGYLNSMPQGLTKSSLYLNFLQALMQGFKMFSSEELSQRMYWFETADLFYGKSVLTVCL